MAMHELAQLNVATLLAPLDSPRLADFVADLARINALAEAAPGFVWRLQDEHGDATALRPFGDDVVVKTVAHRAGKEPVAVDYRMAKTNGAWKVYDVVVEGVSLVQNYRSTFSAEIAKSGVDGLIKVLEQRNAGGKPS